MSIPCSPMELLSRAATLPLQHRPLIPFLKEPWTSKSKWPAILLEVFLYGIYVVLFASSSFMLWRQKVAQRMLLAITSILFVLASTDIIVTVYFFFRFVLIQSGTTHSNPSSSTHETWNRVLEAKFAVYVVANSVTSGILIRRCYTIWENKRIIVAPIALVLIGTVISFASIGASHLGDKLLAASFITSAAANLSVTFLIATGLLWTSRKVRGVIRVDISMITNYITSLLFDSGAFYSLSIFLYLVFHTLVLDASLTQIACISTTAIIMRNLHSCEPLGRENTGTVYSTALTRPDLHVPEPVYPHPHPQHRGVPSSLGRPTREMISDDNISIDSEYK